jgi:hypothetical protein
MYQLTAQSAKAKREAAKKRLPFQQQISNDRLAT